MSNTTNTLHRKILLHKLRQLEHEREMQREKEISDYKQFYRTHLLHLVKEKKRDAVLKQFSTIKKIWGSKSSFDEFKLESEINSLLRDYLKEPFRKIYEEDVKLDYEQKTYNYSKGWSIVANLYDISKHSIEKTKQKKQKQERLLGYAESCLRSYGLSPIISDRSDDKKKYNLSIITKDLSEKNRTLLSRKELDEHFLDKYSQKRPIKIEGTEIQYSNIHQVKITSTLLQDDEIELFALKNDFEWNDNYKDKGTFIEYCKNETDDILNNQKYSVKAFYAEVEQLLKPYSEAHKVYCKALSKLESGIYERNMLDDLRLSLEALINALLGNNGKSIENQTKEIGQYLKKRNANPHVNNLLWQLIDYYMKYQNNYVKHINKDAKKKHDDVKENEVEFIFDLTSTFIKFLVSV